MASRAKQAADMLEETDLWYGNAATALTKGLISGNWDPAGYALIYARLGDILDTLDRIADALTDSGND